MNLESYLVKMIKKLTKTSINLIMILILVFVCSCTHTKVQFSKNKIETNSTGIVASRTIKNDGTIEQKIDTNNQNWWDIVKTTTNNFFNGISSFAGKTNINTN